MKRLQQRWDLGTARPQQCGNVKHHHGEPLERRAQHNSQPFERKLLGYFGHTWPPVTPEISRRCANLSDVAWHHGKPGNAGSAAEESVRFHPITGRTVSSNAC